MTNQETAMTNQTIPAEIIGAETESQDYQHRGGLRREYATRITVVINTPDLTRINLTRPIMIHQEADTPTPPNALAVGSEWEDADALAEACEESGRDQIAVTDKEGDVSVWGAYKDWWETGTPGHGFEPFTIIHAGKEADQ